jgi:hypothetical protein
LQLHHSLLLLLLHEACAWDVWLPTDCLVALPTSCLALISPLRGFVAPLKVCCLPACRALQGGGIDHQGTLNSPAWATVINSTVTNNAAELPRPSKNISLNVFGMPTQQLVLPSVDAMGAANMAGLTSAGGPSSSSGGSSSSGSKLEAVAAVQSSDEFQDLFGVGGGLRLVAAALVATNSSMGGNTAARLGPQVALLQGCWQVRHAAAAIEE